MYDVCLINKELYLSQGFKDQISEKLFPSDGPKGLEPKQTFGDGNCLYRAMSKIISGNENRHVELRVRTFIELCCNKDKYLNNCYLKELTGLDDYMENLLGSSFDLSSKNQILNVNERALRLELWITSSLAHIQPCGTFLHLATSWVFLFKQFTRTLRALSSIAIM